MPRRPVRWGWLETMWLVSIVLLLALLVWVITGATHRAASPGVSAAEEETSVADAATVVTDDLIASLAPSPYPAPSVVLPPVPAPSVFGPEDPYSVGSSCGLPLPMSERLLHADVVALGTVVEVPSPRWTTPDGTRPANPHTDDETIYTPIVVEVERYLKGEQPTQRLGVFGSGGQIGQDSVSSRCFVVNEGDRVVLFLRPSYFEDVTYNDLHLWAVSERFWVQDEQVTSPEGWSAPLPQVLADIEAASQP